MNAIICVVIYNVKIKDTKFYKSFLSAELNGFYSLLIYDNSLVKDNFEKDKLNGVALTYIHDPKNSGVAGAYNHAAKLCQEQQKDWMILFDQDTQISRTYFQDLAEAKINNPDVHIFCPHTMSNGIYISPSTFKYGRSWASKKTSKGLTTTFGKTIINSGIAVSIKEFINLGGYTSKLPLDFSDHHFFYKYKANNDWFYVLETINHHELSSLNEFDFIKTYSRFIYYFKSAKIFRRLIKNDLVVFWAFIRAIKLSIKFKKHQFLTHALDLQKK